MNYIILDFEWNQSFASVKPEHMEKELTGEIIQIGAVKLDENCNYVDNFKIFVKPKYYTKMHSKVKRLTGITTKDLELGIPFSESYKHFRKWCGEHPVFLTWGAEDKTILEQNIKVNEIEEEKFEFYDLQAIFEHQITKDFKQYKLSDAVELVGEEMKEAHDAFHDAFGTYYVSKHLNIPEGIRDYEQIEHKYVDDIPGCMDVTIYTIDEEKRIFQDDRIKHFMCPNCGKIHNLSDYTYYKNKSFFAVGNCTEQEKYIVRLKKRMQLNGKYTIFQYIFPYEAYKERYEKLLIKRREFELHQPKTT